MAAPRRHWHQFVGVGRLSHLPGSLAAASTPVASDGSPATGAGVLARRDFSIGWNAGWRRDAGHGLDARVRPADLPGLTLTFQWAADDSGQVRATRGQWVPKWSLNSLKESDLVTGIWPAGESYVLGAPVSVTSGFKPGENVMYFRVQGNGGTDGLSVMNTRFTNAVPEPSTLSLFGLSLIGLGLARRRLRK